MMKKSKLKIDSISYSIKDSTILENLSFNVLSDDIVSIIGPSAAGKTTLLRIIAGFDKIDRGNVQINDAMVDNTKIFVESHKRKVGIIFQDIALFPHLSCKDNILFGISTQENHKQDERLQYLSDILNINEIKNKFPHEISGGQQQRVAIARALAPKPEILLLDEPFSALDEELKDQLIKDLRKLLKKERITSIIITHNIKESFQISDKVAYLSSKRILQCDTPYDLYHRPSSREIANFCGIGSFLKGVVIDSNHIETSLGVLFGNTSPFSKNDLVDVMVRPDDVIHDDDSTQSAKVVEKFFHGSDFLYKLELNDGQNVLCFTPSHHDHSINEMIGIKAELDHLILFNR